MHGESFTAVVIATIVMIGVVLGIEKVFVSGAEKCGNTCRAQSQTMASYEDDRGKIACKCEPRLP